ncbi:hypothetical protein EGW08_007376, partial [Elysia chlorotica]
MLQDGLSEQMTPSGPTGESRGGTRGGHLVTTTQAGLTRVREMLREADCTTSGVAPHSATSARNKQRVSSTLATPEGSSSFGACVSNSSSSLYAPAPASRFGLVNENNGNSSRDNRNHWRNGNDGEIDNRRGVFCVSQIPHRSISSD